MIKILIWTKDAVEPITFICENISFIDKFVVMTASITESSFVPIEMIRLMERTVILREPTNSIPEVFGEPIRSGTLITPELEKTIKKKGSKK